MAVQVWNPSTGRWEQDLSSPRLDSEFWASLYYMWPLLNKTKQFIFSKEGHTYNSCFFTERETELPRREKQLGFTPRLIEQLSTAWGVHYMLCPGLDCPLTGEINQTVGKSAQWAMAVKK